MNTRVDIKELLRHANLLAIAEHDFPFMAGTFNGKYTREGPCPLCGGKTKLRLRQDSRTGTQKLFCEGQCELNGADAIGYLRWRDGKSFTEACEYLACGVTTTPETNFTQTPVIDAAPNTTWQTKAREFINGCQDYLWSAAGRPALEYLRSRCLTDETIRRAQLGYVPTRKQARGVDWGLPENTIVKCVPGITIPRVILGELWAVNIRRMVGSEPYSGADKYKCVTGSKLGLWGADSLAGAAKCVSFGGEFDAILAMQHALPGMAIVSFGGEKHSITQPWRNMLNGVTAVYVCLDNDAAGDAGAMQWISVDAARRVRVPACKDLTEYAQAGGDVAAWLAAIARPGEPLQKPQPDIAEKSNIHTWVDDLPVTVLLSDLPLYPQLTADVLRQYYRWPDEGRHVQDDAR